MKMPEMAGVCPISAVSLALAQLFTYSRLPVKSKVHSVLLFGSLRFEAIVLELLELQKIKPWRVLEPPEFMRKIQKDHFFEVCVRIQSHLLLSLSL